MLKKLLLAISFLAVLSALNLSGLYLFAFSSSLLAYSNIILFSLFILIHLSCCQNCKLKNQSQILIQTDENHLLLKIEKDYEDLFIQTLKKLDETSEVIRNLSGKKSEKVNFDFTLPDREALLEERKKIFLKISESFPLEDLKKMASSIHKFKVVSEIYHKIPYLNQLLHNVIEKTEEAAFTLIDKFDLIATENRKVNEEAQKTADSLKKGEDNKSFLEVIGETKTAIQDDKDMIGELVKLNQNNLDKLNKMVELIDKINHGLINIIQISDKNKTISFNLSIEAVKLGDKGKGVMMIVREIQKLNQMTNDSTKEISSYMKTFKNYNEVLMKEWISKTEEIIHKIENTNEKSEKVILTLLNSYEITGDLFIRLSVTTEKINKSMSKIMESLQFQDITRQQIENINSFLNEIKDSILSSKDHFSLLGIHIDENEKQIQQKIKDDWMKKVTVFDERNILK